LELPEALERLRKKLKAGPLVPDADGRVRLRFKGGLELVLVPAARGRVVAEVPLGALPAAADPREERARTLLLRALAMMKTAEEVVSLDETAGQLTVWRQLDLPSLTPAALEEQVARLLDRAEWLAGEAQPVQARPVGPLLFFP
jgi:hypothetical protein